MGLQALRVDTPTVVDAIQGFVQAGGTVVVRGVSLLGTVEYFLAFVVAWMVCFDFVFERIMTPIAPEAARSPALRAVFKDVPAYVLLIACVAGVTVAPEDFEQWGNYQLYGTEDFKETIKQALTGMDTSFVPKVIAGKEAGGGELAANFDVAEDGTPLYRDV